MNERIRKMDNNKRSAQCGSALVTVMIVLTVIFIATAGLSSFALNTVHRVHRMTDTIRAKAIAEAGANQAYNQLRVPENYNKLRNDAAAFPQTDFAGGSYEIVLEPDADGRTRVISIGRFGRAEERVGLEMRDDNYDEAGGTTLPEFLEYAVFCNGAMTMNGAPQELNGNLQINGSFVLNGNYENINGAIAAPPPNNIPEQYQADWEVVHFPRLDDPDFQDFLAEARAAGILTEYDGNQTIRGDQTFEGVTVVDGSVTFQGGGTRKIEGLLYVNGSFTVNGSTELSGAILVGGSMTINGSSAILSHDPIQGIGEDVAGLEPNVVTSVWWD